MKLDILVDIVNAPVSASSAHFLLPPPPHLYLKFYHSQGLGICRHYDFDQMELFIENIWILKLCEMIIFLEVFTFTLLLRRMLHACY